MTGSASLSSDRNNSAGIGLLAVAAGGSDVIAFLMLGHVFASAMTGNTALLGISLGSGRVLEATQPLAALLGFIAGAAFATLLYRPDDPEPRRVAALRVLLPIEIGLLLGFAVTLQVVDRPAGGLTHYGLILLCSSAMGVQGVAAKIINAPGLNTIVFTSTLVSIVSSVTGILLGRVKEASVKSATWRQITVFGAYALGVVIAGMLDWADVAVLIYLPAVAVALALACFEVSTARSGG